MKTDNERLTADVVLFRIVTMAPNENEAIDLIIAFKDQEIAFELKSKDEEIAELREALEELHELYNNDTIPFPEWSSRNDRFWESIKSLLKK